MIRNCCVSFCQSSMKLKLPPEFMPGLLVIQIQIQAMCLHMSPTLCILLYCFATYVANLLQIYNCSFTYIKSC